MRLSGMYICNESIAPRLLIVNNTDIYPYLFSVLESVTSTAICDDNLPGLERVSSGNAAMDICTPPAVAYGFANRN
jgi:hypothetical protein